MTTDTLEKSAESASALPRKLGQDAGEHELLPPGFEEHFAEAIDSTFAKLTSARVTARLSENQVKAPSSLLSGNETHLFGAMVDLCGQSGAAVVAIEPELIFTVVDLMLGGNADDASEPGIATVSPLALSCCRLIGEAIACAFATAARKHSVGIAPLAGCERAVENFDILAYETRDAKALTLPVLLSFGKSGRSAMLHFCIQPRRLEEILGTPKGRSAPSPKDDDPWYSHMKQAVLTCEMEMLAILHREEMSVAELSRLDVNQVIPMPSGSLNNIVLFADCTAQIGLGELGKSGGRRAVRLSDRLNKEFLSPLYAITGPNTTSEQ